MYIAVPKASVGISQYRSRSERNPETTALVPPMRSRRAGSRART